MKTKKTKQLNNKFDLEKMKVAKLKNVYLINGGYNILGFDGDIGTVTQSGQNKTKETISY